MMDWLGLAPVVLVSLALVFVPGLALGFSLGMRRLWLWALAPAFSATMLVLGATVLPVLKVRWSLFSALSFALVFGVLVVLLYRFVLRSRFDDQAAEGQAWPALVGWVTGGLLLSVYLALGVIHPENISQTFDNVFHLNAIAYITETGSASPFTIGGLTSPGGGLSFYPLAWHGLVQLVQQTAGVSSAAAINAVNLAITSSVWPVGVMLLTRQFVGASRIATISSGILAAAFPAFPLNMLTYGVLYPYFAGVALVPVAYAVVLQLLGITRDKLISNRQGLAILLLGLVPGIVLSHPVALMTVLALSVPAVFAACFSGWTQLENKVRRSRLFGLVVYLAFGLGMLVVVRPGVKWGTRTTLMDAIWRALTLSLEGYGLPLLIAMLTLAGVFFSLRRPNRVSVAAVGAWAVITALYVLTAGLNSGIVRGVTGVWYGDSPRLAAIMPSVVIPLAVITVVKLLDRTRDLRGRVAIECIALATLLIVTQLSAGYGSFIQKMNSSYASNNTSVLLTTDERTLLERLPYIVPEDEMIVGSPWTGTSLAYAFSGRGVVIPHMLITPGDDRDEIIDSLDQAYISPSVCNAVNRLNVRWFLDFGDVEVHGAVHTYPGLDDLVQNGIVELADREGEARLYRIIACVST